MNETMHNASSRPAVRAIVLACCAAMVAGSMPVYAAPPSATSAQSGNPGNPGDEVSLNFVTVSYTHLTLPTSAVACRSRWSPYH